MGAYKTLSLWFSLILCKGPPRYCGEQGHWRCLAGLRFVLRGSIFPDIHINSLRLQRRHQRCEFFSEKSLKSLSGFVSLLPYKIKHAQHAKCS